MEAKYFSDGSIHKVQQIPGVRCYLVYIKIYSSPDRRMHMYVITITRDKMQQHAPPG